ncbi:LacI family DNA-binding transcriptional regulator [Pseudoruegeria sp. SHC-113]|uniref:LacI family DNA-binding transcriptional regulator n=1 Tax=Pseudoruegeria sp. SHC-113 TaxID=2855439 RepID=UPI0021BAF23F|nr:LacI family DNA-binding transcriptional regulator [Pseudoruegeria sp. SHC-113]MCT8161700.1 LacI family transcriptional regulator [Pseudoruegeria sp. SHC-113]
MVGQQPKEAELRERATIKSIARDLGISHMTVSRALSGHPNVQKETREAVQAHAQAVGYVKSAAASVMRGAGAPIAGLLLPNITNEFYAHFANSLALACDAQKLQLIIHLTGDEAEAEALALQRLREVQARFVVSVPTPTTEAEALPPDGPALIHLIRRRTDAPEAPAILIDDAPALKQAVGALAKAGHRRIAYIGADQSLSSGESRLTAVREGLTEAGLTESETQLLTGPPGFATGEAFTRGLIASGTATAILCGGFEISAGVLAALQQAPEARLTMIGYGDPSYYRWIGGGISAIALPVKELARQTAEMIASPPAKGETRRVPAGLTIRALPAPAD